MMTAIIECFHSCNDNNYVSHNLDSVNYCFLPKTTTETVRVREVVALLTLNVEDSHEKTLKLKHNKMQHSKNGNKNVNSNKTPSHYKLLLMNKGSSKFAKHEEKWS